MKSIANQYRDLKEGRMSQANFMRNLRMSMPQHITNVTSFDDSIRILKNKGILTESHLGNDRWFDAFQDAIEGMELSPENHKRVIDSLDHVDPLAKYGDMKPDRAAKDFVDHVLNANKEAKEDSNNSLLDEVESEMENGNSYAEAISAVAAKHNIDEDKLANMVPEESVGDKAYADDYDGLYEDNDEDDEIEAMIAQAEEEESGKHTKFEDVPGAISEKSYKVSKDAIPVSSLKKGDVLGGSGLEVVSISAGAKTPSGKIEVTVKDPKTGKELTKVWNKSTKVTVKKDLSEGKGKDLHPNQIHPQELRMGIKVELEHTDDLDKAKKIALDHLAENPYYYTALKLSGIESPSVFTAKAPVKKGKKKDSVQLVDLVNQMKKVKIEKKKLKEARYNIDGEPNVAAEQAMKFVDGNATLKALSDDIEIQQSQNDAILRYQYWKPLPPEAVEKLKLQFDVEVISDYDEDTGNIIAYRLVPLRGKEEKYRAFQSKLETLVREVLDEMQSDEQETDEIAMSIDEYFFDGRDNLADEIAAQQK